MGMRASSFPMKSSSAGFPGGLSSESVPILEADAVLARIIPGGSLEQVIFRVDALHWIEERGVLVVNSPRTIERCVDKFYTTALLHDAGLPTPETVVCEQTDEALAAVRSMGECVIKPIFGSLGHGMVRVSEPEVARRIVRSLEQTRTVFYVQKAIDHGGRDIRAFVVGGAVLGAIERRAPEGEWRTNVAIGGSATTFELPHEWAQLAVRAANAVGADYAGVDLSARPRRPDLRTRGQRHSGMGRLSESDRDRRRRGDRRPARCARQIPRTSPRRRSGMTPARSAEDIAAFAQLACLLEASAPKPGNVSPGRHFVDLTYEDFLASAVAIAPAFMRVADQGVGETIRQAIDATTCRTRTNTNLGIVLLLAPLARAAAMTAGDDLRQALRRVLDGTSLEDARQVYAAIRRARPGGLGRSDTQDVASRAGCHAARRDASCRRSRRHRPRVRHRFCGHVRARRTHAHARTGRRLVLERRHRRDVSLVAGARDRHAYRPPDGRRRG